MRLISSPCSDTATFLVAAAGGERIAHKRRTRPQSTLLLRQARRMAPLAMPDSCDVLSATISFGYRSCPLNTEVRHAVAFVDLQLRPLDCRAM
ncbi:hypothetical protein C8T65DRAFT_681486, partial [Cerioporus squamosus]